ncbi:MAG: DUF4442 domain-containing protein [Proteobacteria bacterium]|nr:MAG: DUF4442 domain-containing protein [Pseudomonadota bacterium]QKK10993.1 MAG: DUF4442 domain-containing protein [Pseudomonadota bacterium]
MNRPECAEWQSYLHREIPITAAMGLQVTRLDAQSIELRAPLSLNHNDKNTGFAGSLFTVAVLAGWSQVMLLLRDADLSGQAVISDSQVRYLKPATADFRALASQPSAAALRTFYEQLGKRGRARLTLTIEVTAGGEPVLRFAGKYAAMLS